jgi:ferritin
MIGKKMEQALNVQINAELYSSYLYLAMAAYFESVNLGGLASWMTAQAGEERGHAMRLYGHINERAGRVILDAIKKPASEWKSPLAAFEAAYAHEQAVTGMINDLVSLAKTENDNPAQIMLQWFVEEQVEEEASALAVVEKLKLVGDSTAGLFMLDQALGQRKAE